MPQFPIRMQPQEHSLVSQPTARSIPQETDRLAPLHFAVLRQGSTSGPIALGKWESQPGAQRFARGTWDTFLLEIAPELGDIQLVQLGAHRRSRMAMRAFPLGA